MDGDTKVAILGGRGMLGSDVAARCAALGIEHGVFDLPEFDVTNRGHVAEVVRDYGVIVNCAAYTDVERAESEPEKAYQVNCEAVKQLAVLARKSEAWVLHISTDFVFDGKKSEPYVETDPCKPINTYGMTKFAGERVLSESRCDFCILRLEWTYGRNGQNFVTKIVERARSGEVLKVVDDQIGSPTATTEAAEIICQLVGKRPTGVFHFAAEGYVSRFGAAQFIVEKLRLRAELKRCSSKEFKSAARRPLSSRFNCKKIKSRLSVAARPWQQPLEEFIRQL